MIIHRLHFFFKLNVYSWTLIIIDYIITRLSNECGVEGMWRQK